MAVCCKIRLRFWICNLEKIVKSIRNKCVVCRKRNKVLLEQQMGQLPVRRLKPAPPWMSVNLDLFGPYDIRGTVNKRVRRKVYGVIITCMLTRGVHIDVADGYSTYAFLLVLRRFMSIRGSPLYLPLYLITSVLIRVLNSLVPAMN